jgi:hypothetical protein
MDLQILTNPGPKPPIHIYVDDLTAREIDVTTMNITNLEIKGDLKVDGYSNSETLNAGMVLLAAANAFVSTPAGTGGGTMNYNPSLNQVFASGLAGGVSTYMVTNDGSTWTQVTLPSADVVVQYSPTLNFYSGIHTGGNQVYTSVSAATGTWTAQPAAPFNFSGDAIAWIPGFNKFYTDTTDPANVLCYSSDGINYIKVPSTRIPLGFAYSGPLNMIVMVGPNGPSYSLDGISWANSVQTYPMEGVCWSDFWKMFVAIPRGGDLTAIYTSVDGKTWVLTHNAFPTSPTSLRCIAWSQQYEVFAVLGDHNFFFLSQDGFSWRQVNTTDAGQAIYGCIFVDQWGLLSGTGNGHFAFSTAKLYQ